MGLRVFDLAGNDQALDGGALFGNAPKKLWERWVEVDDANRVRAACRAFLVEADDQRILLETGVGAYMEPKLKERFGVMQERHVLLDSLAALGLEHTSVDLVILSHLHFDHAGGLLSAFEEGQDPELLFPRARFLCSRGAMERACNPHRRDRASFVPGLAQRLSDSGRLSLVDEDESSYAGLDARFSFFQTHGHTPGMLHTRIEGSRGRAVFCADLVPGLPWVHPAISMGYDRFPEALIDEKWELLSRCAQDNVRLLFTHDRQYAAASIRGSQGASFELAIGHEVFAGGWDLDAES